MADPNSLTAADFEGQTIADVARVLGKTHRHAKDWLFMQGYRAPRNGIGLPVRRQRTAIEVEQEIADRIASAAPADPCWRCGARAGCAHRPSTTITNGERP